MKLSTESVVCVSDTPQSQITSGGESDVVMNAVNGDVPDGGEAKEEEDMEEGE